MATITRYQAEQYITQVFNEYLEALKKAKKNKKKILPEAYELFEGMEEFNQFVKSVDLQQKVYNRLNIQGIEELLTGCVNLSKLYDLQVYDSIKNIRISEDDHYYKITNAVTSYSVGGTYTFNIEPINEIEKQWYEFYTKTWNCYKFNESTKKYEEYVVGLNEQRMVLDTNTNDRTFLFTEPGKYRITAAVFKQSWNPFAQQIPELNEVDEIEINVENNSDSKIANLSNTEKLKRAMAYADKGESFKNLGLDIAAMAVTIVLFVGIGVLLKKIPAGKLKPFLMKITKKLAIEELLTFFGTVGDAFDVAACVQSICTFNEQAVNAQNEEQLKEAGKTFEKVIETLGLVAVMTFMNIIGRCMKKGDVEDELKNLDEIADDVTKTIEEDTAVQKYLNELNEKSIKKLNKRSDGYEILKRYKDFFGDNVEFVNELIENTPGKEIYVEPVQLLVKNAEKYNTFYDYCKSIKKSCKTNEQWVKYQIECYNNLSKGSKLRINAQPVIDARYLLPDGSIDWPKFMGMKPETIEGLSINNTLPTELSRKGTTNFGKTYGDNPNLTNAEIATPFIDNPDAVHFGVIPDANKNRYFELVDLLCANNDTDFCKYFSNERIAKKIFNDASRELNNFYSDVEVLMGIEEKDCLIKGIVDKGCFLLEFKSLEDNSTINFVCYKYGLQGVIAPWKKNEELLLGGGKQFSLPFTMDTLYKLGVIEKN